MDALEEYLFEDTDYYETGMLPLMIDSYISASDLLKAEFCPVNELVEGLLTQGLSIIAAPPKTGKSWLCLDLCMAIAKGLPFMGKKTQEGRVLYLALEDTERRLQSRLNKLLQGEEAPEKLWLFTRAEGLQDNLLGMLHKFLTICKDVKLIVIDTLQKIRDSRNTNLSYSNDYNELSELKAFADGHDVAILLVHHTRKMPDSDDVFNTISGTNGIMGCADTAIVLSKSGRFENTAKMSITGRDIEGAEYAVEFDKNKCRWKMLGESEEYNGAVEDNKLRRKYLNNPIVTTICYLVEQKGNYEWNGSIDEIIERGLEITGKTLAISNKGLACELDKLRADLWKYSNISTIKSRNTNNTTQYYFTKTGEKGETGATGGIYN